MAIEIQGRRPAAPIGRTFSTDLWAWRPIHALICELCANLIDDKALQAMAFGGGAGPTEQATCSEMAVRFENWLQAHPNEFVVETGIRTTPEGRFLTEQELADHSSQETVSPYSVRPEQIEKWIAFLKSCGGFEVW